jgi:hypothetical protein
MLRNGEKELTMDDFKTCSVCGQQKHFTKFSLQRSRAKALRKTYCIDCEREKKKKSKIMAEAISNEGPLSYNLLMCAHEFPQIFPFVQAVHNKFHRRMTKDDASSNVTNSTGHLDR